MAPQACIRSFCIVLLGAVASLCAGGPARAGAPQYYFGADLSYVNELEDCGAEYRLNGERRDPFGLFRASGANLVRVRLWNDAKWTRYSDLPDVARTISRARQAGMQVLLNFHYSDDWADGDKQIIPKAWERITDTEELARRLHDFTLTTLRQLDARGLMPELVQVGNETNGEILSTLEKAKDPINWERNARLFNAAIQAVRTAGAASRTPKPGGDDGETIVPRVMLHIAQPENVEPWFAAAARAGVRDFDLIGISYYRKWSTQDLAGLGAVINRLRHTYPADVLLVEAAYPWTLENADTSANILGADSLLAEYPATVQGQRRYLIDLSQLVLANGGVGVVYWEPAWISSSCKTRWGTGSGWDNAALFDFDGNLLPGAGYLSFPYIYPVAVEFRLPEAGSTSGDLYLWGDFLGGAAPVRLERDGSEARWRTRLMPGTRLRFQLYDSPDRSHPLLEPDPADPNGYATAVVGIEPGIVELHQRSAECAECARPDPAAIRADGNFNSDWQFHRFERPVRPSAQPNVPADGWQKVSLPHTPKIEPRIVNSQWQGDAVYRKRFHAPPEWRGKQVWLRFEAAMNKAEIWLNGRRIATHLGGYLPFVIDLTDRLQPGAENELLVWLDNRDNPITGPKPLEILDFNTYGGLCRGASLVIKDPLHITDEMLANRRAGGGIFVTYPHVSAERADVSIQTHVRNASRQARTFRVRQWLWNGTRLVARASSDPITLAPGRDTHNVLRMTVDRPRLWSPRAPNLHHLVTRIESDGAVVDEKHTRLGIRQIEITREGFRINGEQMFLRGVNRHQEYPYVGYAISPAADYRDAKRIKEAGFDFVRLSHYPHSTAFMDAADELGLVLLDAILGWQYFNKDPAFTRHVLQTCRELVRRDRNHPSVIAYECSLNETEMPRQLVQQLHQIVHEEYPGPGVYSAGWQNDGYDVFIQARQHRLQHYEPPDRPYLVSEYGDWEYYALNAGLQQEAWKDLMPEARSSRQLLSDGEIRLLQQAMNVQEAHNDNFTVPAFADAYWVMYDYNRGYAEDLEASGTMSLERLPKFSYYFFRSQRDAHETSARFSAGPFVFIASHWNAQSSPRVRVFGNVEETELFLNGRSLGRRSPDRDRVSSNLAHPPFSFALDSFEPGVLEAVGYVAGRAVAFHRVVTQEDPVRLELQLDDAGVCWESNDLLFARARLAGQDGYTVPVSARAVQFEAGDAARIEGAQSAAAEAGIASVLVRVTGDSPVRLKANSGELTAELVVNPPQSCVRR